MLWRDIPNRLATATIVRYDRHDPLLLGNNGQPHQEAGSRERARSRGGALLRLKP
jgi:hypothetical protein